MLTRAAMGGSMCRFNLILVKEERSKQYLEENEYNQFYKNLNGYMAYQKGYCNCGSVVGSLLDRTEESYSEAIDKRQKEKVERLYEIRNLMHHARYQMYKESFLQKQKEYLEEMDNLSKYITEYERKELEDAEKKYEGEEFDEKIGEIQLEVSNMLMKLDENAAYKKALDKYASFIEENELMRDAQIYYLTRAEEEQAFIASQIELPDSLKKLKEQEDAERGAKAIQIERTSMVIDEVISRAEHETDKENLNEFAVYYQVIKDLLEYEEYVGFATIWSEAKELKDGKTINLDSLLIDDLAFLEFDDMLCIVK